MNSAQLEYTKERMRLALSLDEQTRSEPTDAIVFRRLVAVGRLALSIECRTFGPVNFSPHGRGLKWL
jgi:hypothetical protein